MSETSIEGVIRNHPFLRDLNPEHVKTLAACAMVCSFAPGEHIFHEGDPANRFYLIETGEVGIEAHGEEGEPIRVQTLGSGDVLGWSWLFPPYYWHFDARALAPTTAVFFYGTRLREQCETDPLLGYELLRRVSQVLLDRLQATRGRLLALTRQSAAAARSPTPGPR
ncbi:MAG TPA: Crp/Fnr family transcriptional regulator [Methylomirabilota bacterium]|nr:Crp/Fnr family transcriptional regulator [Methylomirabilota bacterium]